MFIMLTIEWKNHIGQHVTDHSDLPPALVAAAKGSTVFEFSAPRLPPIR